jgi:hypothetical protein
MGREEDVARLTPSIVLIVLGVVFLISRFIPVYDWFWLLVVGVVFLVAYWLTRGYSFLIPGAILIGLGTGLFLAGGSGERYWGFIPLGLGVGFLFIYILDVFYSHASNWWPTLPGGLLVATGLAGLAGFFTLIPYKVWDFWPLILIAIGGWILYEEVSGHESATGEGRGSE